MCLEVSVAVSIQGYLAHKKTHPPRTLQKDHAQDPRGVLGVLVLSHGRGTPIVKSRQVSEVKNKKLSKATGASRGGTGEDTSSKSVSDSPTCLPPFPPLR